MINLTNKQKVLIGIGIFLVIITCYIVFQNSKSNQIVIEEAKTEDVNNQEKQQEEIPEPPKDILVHIGGRVKNGGLVRLKEGARINDAIISAGGLLKDADMDKVNLAAVVSDGEKIYIPKKGEIVPQISVNQGGTGSNSGNKIININTASKEELDKINGIGPSTADKIIEYRQKNGNFKSIEDLKKVSGIGDKKFEKIKNSITI